MAHPLTRLTIKGYKSIRALEDFELRSLNVLIGANGSGKSNFVSFFHLLREMMAGRLALAIDRAGGADRQLYLGPKVTTLLEFAVQFASLRYELVLAPTVDNRFIVEIERCSLNEGQGWYTAVQSTGPEEEWHQLPIISEELGTRTVYHLHDTSETAPVRRTGSVRDNDYLRPDAGNLAAYLYRLREEHPPVYALIRDTVRLAAPFFRDFKLRPKKANGDEHILLEWEQVHSDYPFHPSQLSDGTLRFMALATVLLQPEPPATILIDEPELGLHPYALNLLASLIQQATDRTQVIVCTQSPALLNAFEPEDVVVIDRVEGESRFRRLNREELAEWLEDYTLGELWQKNVYGGGPAHE